MEFVAEEIARQEYQFLPKLPTFSHEESTAPLVTQVYDSMDRSSRVDDDPDAAGLSMGNDGTQHGSNRADHGDASLQTAGFKSNQLHDFESLWWIAIYFLVEKRLVIGGEPCETTPAQLRHAKELFSDMANRLNVLISPVHFQSVINSLHPRIRPVAQMLGDMREKLVEAYSKVERDIPNINRLVVELDFYESFGAGFMSIARSLTNQISFCALKSVPTTADEENVKTTTKNEKKTTGSKRIRDFRNDPDADLDSSDYDSDTSTPSVTPLPKVSRRRGGKKLKIVS